MKTTLRIGASIALVAIFIEILNRFLHWMNRPSDFWLWTGLLGQVSLLILTPAVLAILWNGGRRGERG